MKTRSSVFLDNLLKEISKRIVNNEERVSLVGGGVFTTTLQVLSTLYLKVDRLFNAYQRDLPRNVDFVDEVESR